MKALAWLYRVGSILLRMLWLGIRSVPVLIRGMWKFKRRERWLLKIDRDRETERLDRIRHPEKWRGK